MLLTAKYFCFLDINDWSLPPKKFQLFNSKIKTSRTVERSPLYEGYLSIFSCNFKLSTVEDSFSVSF